VLGARAGVDDDSCGQELWITADEILRYGGDAHDRIADAKNHRAFEKAGEKTVDDLETLSNKI